MSPTSLAWGIRNRNTSAITKTVEVTNSGSAPLLVTNRTRTGTNAASWSQPTGCVEPVLPEESCLVSISFLTGATAGTKTATLNIFTNGGNKTVGLTGTLVTNTQPVGVPTISDTTPLENQQLTASTAGITDADGLTTATFSYRWQQSQLNGATPYEDIVGSNTAQFTPGQDQVNRRLRVITTATDDHGTTFSRTSAATQVVGDVFVGGAAAESWTGTAQADVASGGGGNDTMNGLAGDDRISGGPGNDTITPGGGLDVVVFAPGDGADTVAGFDFNPTGGQDKLDISAFGITAGTFNDARSPAPTPEPTCW